MPRRKKLVSLMPLRKTSQRIIERTNEIEVGGIYFLSSFYDKEGAWVKILNKSTKINKAGWPSTVTYEVLQVVGKNRYHTVGMQSTCNATNLYEKQERAGLSKRNS